MVAGLLLLSTAGFVGAQPSTSIADYTLFGDDGIRTQGLTVTSGDVGVNAPIAFLRAPRFLLAPSSNLVADAVIFERKNPANTECAELFANFLVRGPDAGCGASATPFSPPVIPDLAAACGFPAFFPACDPDADVTVAPGDTLALPPGTYGDLVLKSFKSLGVLVSATVELDPGVYQFCTVKASRGTSIEFQGPGATTVHVAKRLNLKNETYTGPAPASGVAESDVRIFVAEGTVGAGRMATVRAHLCAPTSKLRLSKGGAHRGVFAAASVRATQVTLDLGSPSGAFPD